METKLIYDAPRQIQIGDIFYVIVQREYEEFMSPCRVCNDKKHLTMNGVTFNCPVCNSYYGRSYRDEKVAEIKHYTFMAVKIYKVEQEMSTDTWKNSTLSELHFRVYRKRGLGYNGDSDNFTREYNSRDIKERLNKLPENRDYYNGDNFIYDDYKIACEAADILNAYEQEKLDKYNNDHGTTFAPQWKKTNDPKN